MKFIYTCIFLEEFKPYICLQKMKIYNFVKFLALTLHLSVAVNISYSLLFAAELQDGITNEQVITV